MKTIPVKRQLLEEALDQLKAAQQDKYVLSTQNVIDELEVVLKSVCDHKYLWAIVEGEFGYKCSKCRSEIICNLCSIFFKTN